MRFAKGHGTGNDFVVLPDPDGALQLTPALVRGLCDRRHGLGADGVLRVVPTAKVEDVAHLAADAEWFMDYHNADGTTAEMCGNGIRVYARWLRADGLVDAGTFGVATRDGVKAVTIYGEAAQISVDMGTPQLTGTARTVRVEARSYDGVEVWMGNPHVVARIDDLADAGSLLVAPRVEPALPTNVEFVTLRAPGHVAMRVHERGSGETQSCGTGACAVAVAASAWPGWGGAAPGEWVIDVPGGRLDVSWNGAAVVLRGPAQIVARGELDADWLAALLRQPRPVR